MTTAEATVRLARISDQLRGFNEHRDHAPEQVRPAAGAGVIGGDDEWRGRASGGHDPGRGAGPRQHDDGTHPQVPRELGG